MKKFTSETHQFALADPVGIREPYNIFFMHENASFPGRFTDVSFASNEGNQLSYFQNGNFFKILW